MTLQKQDTEDSVMAPPEPKTEKAPCLETIFKRMQECNGAIQAMYHDLDYITRTTSPNTTEDQDAEVPKTPTPNLANMQNEIDVLRNRIRSCKQKLDKARWG